MGEVRLRGSSECLGTGSSDQKIIWDPVFLGAMVTERISVDVPGAAANSGLGQRGLDGPWDA